MDFEIECLVSLNAYLRISPGSFFGRALKKSDIKNARDSLVFVGFRALAPLAKDRKDYFVILRLIEQDVEETYSLLISGDDKRLSCKFCDCRNTADRKSMEKIREVLRRREKENLIDGHSFHLL